MTYLLIGTGAFFGAIFRHLISSFLLKISFYGFPLGTLSINIIGCYLIGIFISINIQNKDLVGPFFIIGFLGSFTTFSAFTKEVFLFTNINGPIIAYLCALLITSICLLSTFLGYKMFS